MTTPDSPRLSLPYLAAAQSQKHVTVNEALRILDALVQISVVSQGDNTPPANPVEGDAYIVGTAPTGDWAGEPGRIAAYRDGAWLFLPPHIGYVAHVAAEATLKVFDGASWGAFSGGGVSNPTPTLGINATADTTNRLSVKADAALFDAETADHRLKVNKAAAGDTASMLLQTGYSGRAEIGLAGDDDLAVKVSADGSAWNDAIVVDRTSGQVSFPNTSLAGGTYAQRQFATLTTAFTTTDTDWANVATGLAATITPSSTTAAVEVFVSTALGGAFDNTEPQVRIYRDGVKVWPSSADFATLRVYITGTASHYALMPIGILFTDTPGVTTPVTYELRVRSPNGGTVHVNRRHISSPVIFESSMLVKELAP